MKFRAVIFLMLICSCGIVQDLNDTKYQFSKDAFKSTKYKKSNYAKFNGPIEIIGDSIYKFRDKTLFVYVENGTYYKFFQKGIFNPDIIFGKETIKKSQAELILYHQTKCCFII